MPKVKGTKSYNKQVEIKPEAEKQVEIKPEAEKQVEIKPEAEKQVEIKPEAEKQVEVQVDAEPEIIFDEEIVRKEKPYQVVDCRFFQLGNCTKGENCPFKHGAKKICHFINTPNGCRNGDECFFLHDIKQTQDEKVTLEQKIKGKKNKIKTIVCFKWLKSECSFGGKCRFKHVPINYKTRLCRTVENGEVCLYDNCYFAHGEKELRFL